MSLNEIPTGFNKKNLKTTYIYAILPEDREFLNTMFDRSKNMPGLTNVTQFPASDVRRLLGQVNRAIDLLRAQGVMIRYIGVGDQSVEDDKLEVVSASEDSTT